MADIVGQLRPCDSWSTTDVRRLQHTHLWVIKGFSQCECRYLETSITIPNPSAALTGESGGSSQLMFRIRLHPQGNKESNKDFCFFQVFPSVNVAKFKAKFAVFNTQNEEIPATVSTGTQQLNGHMEYIRRDLLISHIQPQDEIQLVLNLTIASETVTTNSQTTPKNENRSICNYASWTERRLTEHIMDSHPQEDFVMVGMDVPSSAGSIGGSDANDIDKLQQELSSTMSSLLESANCIVATEASGAGKPKTYRCKQCQHVSSTKEEQWRHARTHIPLEKQLTCELCEYVTEYKHHLEYHIRNHKGEKPFQCKKCNYQCVNKSMLNSHMKSHNSLYQFKCMDCAYQTKYWHSLKMHLQKYNHRPAPGTVMSDGDANETDHFDRDPSESGPSMALQQWTSHAADESLSSLTDSKMSIDENGSPASDIATDGGSRFEDPSESGLVRNLLSSWRLS